MDDHRRKVEECVDFLNHAFEEMPEIVVISGSGIGGFTDRFKNNLELSYEKIPHFATPTGPGHQGQLNYGNIAGRKTVILEGRSHYYEGYSTREICLPVRVLSLMGADCLITLNAAGGLNPTFSPGTLMLITDHLNFIPDNPLRGPNMQQWGQRFPDMSMAYDRRYIELAAQAAKSLHIELQHGVYVAIPGPSLETPAETRYLRQCGADAVGMSTVPEVIVGRHAGMKVMGISIIANVNNPNNQRPILVEEVLHEAQKASAELERLIVALLPEL